MGRGEHDALGRGLISHKLRNDAAIARDQDSIRDRQYFRQVGGDYRNRLAVVGEFADGAMDLWDRADINAPRRFIKEYDLRFLGECLGEYDLLLVPAGIVGNPQPPIEACDRELFNPVPGEGLTARGE